MTFCERDSAIGAKREGSKENDAESEERATLVWVEARNALVVMIRPKDFVILAEEEASHGPLKTPVSEVHALLHMNPSLHR